MNEKNLWEDIKGIFRRKEKPPSFTPPQGEPALPTEVEPEPSLEEEMPREESKVAHPPSDLDAFSAAGLAAAELAWDAGDAEMDADSGEGAPSEDPQNEDEDVSTGFTAVETPAGQMLLRRGAYHTSEEYLQDALCRIDLLVRAQVVRWRYFIAETKPERAWGMLQVSHEEVERYLHGPCLPPGSAPSGIEEELRAYWRAAGRVADVIEDRLEATPPEIREGLRLWRLETRMGLRNLTPPTLRSNDPSPLRGEGGEEERGRRDTLARDILLVALMPELDGRYRRLFGYFVDDASLRQPTVELILEILFPLGAAERGRAAFEVNAPLVRNHLVVLGGEARGDDGLSMRSVRADDRAAAYLLGGGGFDPRLDGIMEALGQPTESGPEEYDSETAERVEELAEWWQELRRDPKEGGAVLLHGPYGSGRRRAAQVIASGTSLLKVNVARALLLRQPWELLVDLCYREAALNGAGIVWDGCEALLEEAHSAERHEEGDGAVELARWEYLVASAERFPGLTCFISARSWDPAGRFNNRRFVSLGFTFPDYPLRQYLWSYYLTQIPLSDQISEQQRRELALALANDYQLTAGQMRDVLVTARGLALLHRDDDSGVTGQDLFEAARRQSSRQLMNYARCIRPRPGLTLDSLILPDLNKRQLEELAERMQYRGKVYYDLGFEQYLSLGKGLTALFVGSSGTGKTMAAEILAGLAQVNLYKVDLSAVVSKWVGETEKHLNQVFQEAEQASGVLFFDEADALFGKRGEVKDAQDRYANLETNYLLQRIEMFTGTVLLASNLKNNIDEAFLRRIMYVVEFPTPTVDARVQIYQISFTPRVAVPDPYELREVAECFTVLTGSSIKSTCVDATFRAVIEQSYAPDGRVYVTQRHLVLATAREYQKLGMPITPGVFRGKFFEWVKKDILLEKEKQIEYA